MPSLFLFLCFLSTTRIPGFWSHSAKITPGHPVTKSRAPKCQQLSYSPQVFQGLLITIHNQLIPQIMFQISMACTASIFPVSSEILKTPGPAEEHLGCFLGLLVKSSLNDSRNHCGSPCRSPNLFFTIKNCSDYGSCVKIDVSSLWLSTSFYPF